MQSSMKDIGQAPLDDYDDCSKDEGSFDRNFLT